MRLRHRERSRGQALAEFAIAITVFLMLIMGVFDLGRGIYMYNGVSQAAREIARVTSVHRCSGIGCTTLGTSAQTAAVVATQKGLIPNLQNPIYSCVDIDGTTITTPCTPGDLVQVRIVAPYTPVTPLMGLFGTWNLQSTSSVAIQQ